MLNSHMIYIWNATSIDSLINWLSMVFGSFPTLLTLRLNQAQNSACFTWIMLLIIRFAETVCMSDAWMRAKPTVPQVRGGKILLFCWCTRWRRKHSISGECVCVFVLFASISSVLVPLSRLKMITHTHTSQEMRSQEWVFQFATFVWHFLLHYYNLMWSCEERRASADFHNAILSCSPANWIVILWTFGKWVGAPIFYTRFFRSFLSKNRNLC